MSSEESLAKRIAEILKPDMGKAVKETMGPYTNKIDDLCTQFPELCKDVKSVTESQKDTSEKLQGLESKFDSELKDVKSKVEGAMSIKGHTPHDIFDCPTCKPIAIEHLLKDEKHRGGLLEMVCKDGVCKPVVAETLWKDEEYRKDVLGKILKDETQRGTLLEGICTDESCRKDILKIFKEKNIEVTERVGEESWAQRRLRERAERAAKAS